MRVIVDMEIETPDYGGEEFKEEIEKLIKDIRAEYNDEYGSVRLVKFKMRQKFGTWDMERDIDWQEGDVT